MVSIRGCSFVSVAATVGRRMFGVKLEGGRSDEMSRVLRVERP